MTHYTKQQFESAVRSFEPNVFAQEDDLWKPAQNNIRDKLAKMLKSLGHTIDGYDESSG